ncbi:hypothetical protein NDU88_009167 [Pleurodeles waltl]|uniref:Uncharacterized protein n=1 Tax=Pleurodeles waltl TaxID=8319 RepID=A0AAV7P2G4_PLEWA|nr:hypothetical protein NDU88_009167 [Pleurodeles waltl]
MVRSKALDLGRVAAWAMGWREAEFEWEKIKALRGREARPVGGRACMKNGFEASTSRGTECVPVTQNSISAQAQTSELKTAQAEPSHLKISQCEVRPESDYQCSGFNTQ